MIFYPDEGIPRFPNEAFAFFFLRLGSSEEESSEEDGFLRLFLAFLFLSDESELGSEETEESPLRLLRDPVS